MGGWTDESGSRACSPCVLGTLLTSFFTLPFSMLTGLLQVNIIIPILQKMSLRKDKGTQ